jgi:hypothetical protein
MDIREVIRELASIDDYEVVSHCLDEMDKDSLSIYQIEEVLIKGTIAKREPKKNRYTLKWNNIMCCVEIIKKESCYYMTIVTGGRERR